MILPVNFRLKWLLCACMSTVQAPAKDVSWSLCTSARRHFTMMKRCRGSSHMKGNNTQTAEGLVSLHTLSATTYKP